MALSKHDLGKLVKQARKIKSDKIGKKYTQKMLATDIKKSQSYIGDIESGRTYPSFVILNLIADACGISISYFQDEEKTNKDIDKFIKSNLDLKDREVPEIRENIKHDPEIKINYIYDCVKENSTNDYKKFKTPEEAISYILHNPVIKDFCALDIDKMSDYDITDFTNEVLKQIKLVSYKYKK